MKNIVKIFKIDKKNISFLKFIIEAYDGMAQLTTINAKAGIILITIAYDLKDFKLMLDDLRCDFLIEEKDE